MYSHCGRMKTVGVPSHTHCVHESALCACTHPCLRACACAQLHNHAARKSVSTCVCIDVQLGATAPGIDVRACVGLHACGACRRAHACMRVGMSPCRRAGWHAHTHAQRMHVCAGMQRQVRLSLGMCMSAVSTADGAVVQWCRGRGAVVLPSMVWQGGPRSTCTSAQQRV